MRYIMIYLIGIVNIESARAEVLQPAKLPKALPRPLGMIVITGGLFPKLP